MSHLDGTYAHTPLNHNEISAVLLNIEEKSRSNLLAWRGQFSPQLVQTLLQHFAASSSVIFDPFLGSGTVLHEAGLLGLRAAGSEINPAAVMLARLYTLINLPAKKRQATVSALAEKVQAAFMVTLPLFQAVTSDIDEGLSSVERLLELVTSCEAQVQRRLLEALVVLLDMDKTAPSAEDILDKWNGLAALALDLPFSEQPLAVYHADARHIPIAARSIDLVVTSPPYINVFNYHQQYRQSAEQLAWDLLHIARSEIGANRKHRGNRFLTVIQYCLDMAEVFTELRRVSKPDGRMVFVVGRESKVRGVSFANGEIVAEVAHRAAGLQLTLRQERRFLNRFGQHIYEDILHFVPTKDAPASHPRIARTIASDVLESVVDKTEGDVRCDVEAALSRLADVSPSPIFYPARAQ